MKNGYKDMCFKCAEEIYGKPRREVGAITVGMGVCPVCKTKDIPIVPGRDLYYMHAPKVTSADWD